MKKFMVFGLVLILLLATAGPVLAGNGNGNGGRGGGNVARGSKGGNGGGGASSYTIIGLVTAISSSQISVEVYGGKSKASIGQVVTVPMDGATRFLLQDSGPISLADIDVGDAVSVAVGSDGVADRVTVVLDCPCLP